MSSELIHRLHFAFTITFHYLFPQLTMGLGLLIVVLKSVALKARSEQDREHWDRAARFWGRIFAINFVFGVVTGIPMEFEFGTNWARVLAGFGRSDRAAAGDGRRVQLLSGVGVSGAVSLRREADLEMDALVLGGDGVCGIVDLGILHHRDGRVDAASGGL
jgi:hypothetical protein